MISMKGANKDMYATGITVSTLTSEESSVSRIDNISFDIGDVEAIIIIDKKSGIPLFHRVHNEMLNSDLIASFIAAIRSFSTEIALGGLSTFTTDEKVVFLTAGTQVVCALIVSKIVPDVGLHVTKIIEKRFESKYQNISSLPDVSAFTGFNEELDRIFHDLDQQLPANSSYQDLSPSDPVLSPVPPQLVSFFTFSEQGQLEPVLAMDQSQLSSYPLLVVVDLSDKSIFVLKDPEAVSNRLMFGATLAINQLKDTNMNYKFAVRDVFDPLEKNLVLDRAIKLIKQDSSMKQDTEATTTS